MLTNVALWGKIDLQYIKVSQSGELYVYRRISTFY